MKEREKILDKLNKLMAHAASAEAIGSAAEAEAFAGKIQAMLDDYNLSMDEVELHAAKSSPIDGEVIGWFTADVRTEWLIMLLGLIGDINGCIVAGNSQFTVIVGRETDRKVTINFFKYYFDLCRRLQMDFEAEIEEPKQPVQLILGDSYGGYFVTSGTAMFSYGRSVGPSKKTKVESYMFGVASAICEKLASVHRQQTESQTNLAALVYLENRGKEAKKWLQDQVPLKEKEPTDPMLDEQYFNRGHAKGGSVALTDKVLG